MYLNAYVELRNLSIKQFADEIGVAKSSMANYISGRTCVPLKVAITIEKKTKGNVTAMEMWDYAEEKKMQRKREKMKLVK